MHIENIGIKIQVMGQVLSFLGMFASIIMILAGCANYVDALYPDIEDASTALTGLVLMVSSVFLLFLTQGFGQLVINSDEMMKLTKKDHLENSKSSDEKIVEGEME